MRRGLRFRTQFRNLDCNLVFAGKARKLFFQDAPFSCTHRAFPCGQQYAFRTVADQFASLWVYVKKCREEVGKSHYRKGHFEFLRDRKTTEHTSCKLYLSWIKPCLDQSEA